MSELKGSFRQRARTFRRAVATWLDANEATLAEIANQLRHSNVNVTAGYLGRTIQPTRATDVMVLPIAARGVCAQSASDFCHYSVGIDIACSGASNADQFAIAVEVTDKFGSRVEHVTAARGLRPTDAVEKVVKLIQVLDASAPKRAGFTVAADRRGDAGTAEMLENAMPAETWQHVVTVRRVWITTVDSENPPQHRDKTDPHPTTWSVGHDLLLHTFTKRLRTGELDVANARSDAANLLRESVCGRGCGPQGPRARSASITIGWSRRCGRGLRSGGLPGPIQADRHHGQADHRASRARPAGGREAGRGEGREQA